MAKFLKIEVYIPKEYVVDLANELNERNILKQGNYDYVFAQTSVTGSFRPIEGANPTIGEIGKVSVVEEVKVEFRIVQEDIQEVRKIIDFVHPYEEPVVNVIELVD